MSTHRIYHAPPERDRKRADRASDAPPERAEDCIYPMPTVAEVVTAGYAAARWDDIKRERDEFVAKFNADLEFRKAAIARELERRRRDA